MAIDQASKALAALLESLDEADTSMECWIKVRANELAFRIMKADRNFRNERPFDNDGPWATVLEDLIGEAADSVLKMGTAAEDAVVRARRDTSKTLAALDAAIRLVEEAATRTGDVHPQHLPWVREYVYNLTDGCCAYCDSKLDRNGNTETSFFVEHVVPRSSGGPDNIANYVPACRACNCSKSTDHVLTFISRRFPNRERPPAPALTVVPKTEDVA